MFTWQWCRYLLWEVLWPILDLPHLQQQRKIIIDVSWQALETTWNNIMLYQDSNISKHNHHIKHIPSWALPLMQGSERNSKPEDTHHHASLRQCTDHPLSPLLSKKLRQHHIIWVWQGRNQHGSSSCDHGKMWSDMLQYLESVADAGLSSDHRQLRQRVNVTCVSHFFGSFDATGIGLQAARAFCSDYSDCRALKARLGFIFMCVMRLRSSALFAVEWKHARGVPVRSSCRNHGRL